MLNLLSQILFFLPSSCVLSVSGVWYPVVLWFLLRSFFDIHKVPGIYSLLCGDGIFFVLLLPRRLLIANVWKTVLMFNLAAALLISSAIAKPNSAYEFTSTNDKQCQHVWLVSNGR